MIKQIQQIISSKFNLSESKGVFLSCFDKHGNLISSYGVLITEKSLKELIEYLFNRGFNKNKCKVLVVDVVKNIIEVNNIDELRDLNVKERGIFILGDKSGIILPNTKNIPDSTSAISLVVKKNNINSKKVDVYKFSTERFVISF